MIAQAEHIPVHLGAMPDAVAAVHAPRPGARRRVRPQRPVRRRHAPPRHDARLPHRARLRRHARAPRRRRRLEPGSMPADSRTLADEGVVIPPTRLDDETLDGADRADAEPRGAARRFPRAARGTSAGRAAARRARERRGRGRSSRRWTSSTPTRSASCAPRSRAFPTGASRRRRARGGRGRPRLLRAGHDRGRRDRVRLRRNRAAARRQPQLPALGHALGLLLRRPLPDRARPSLLGRRLRARDRQRSRRLARQRAARRPRSPRGTSRPRAGSSTASSPRSARRSPSRRRAGDDEQPHLRQRTLHLLRDARRRPGSLP